MENEMEILVVILSTFLAIFLALAIALTIILIKLAKSLRRVAEKAEGAIDNVESAASAFRSAIGPVALGKFFVNIADVVFNKKKGKE